MTERTAADGRPHFAVGSALFGVFVPIDEQQVKLVSELGFPGLELYGESFEPWADRHADLKALLDQYGVTLITISNRGTVNGRPVDFISPELRQETIDDHLAWVEAAGFEHPDVPWRTFYTALIVARKPTA